jgi:taurine---2-oxoglutarate transaminase
MRTSPEPLSGEEIVRLSRQHTFFPWVAQAAVDPIPIDHGEGVYLYTTDGRRILDFNSGLMAVNAGHGQRRIAEAMAEQALKVPYVNPGLVTEVRARLGARLAELTPGDLDTFYFTTGGTEAVENAITLARHVTGRFKVLARYRSYHGSTAGSMTLTGEPRRWPNEPLIAGVYRIPETHRWGEPEPRPVEELLAETERVIQYEGPHLIAAMFIESVVGTNGVLIPPDGYLAGLRDICDRHGILLVADEVMSGFGRTGRWFAIDHWGVVPDLMTMAKGISSAYAPLGALAIRRPVAEAMATKFFSSGLSYFAHPVALAAGLATIEVYEEDGLIQNAAAMGAVMRRHHLDLQARHPSVGAVRNIGLFGYIELVRSRDPYVPMTAYGGTSDEMKAVARHLREQGVFTITSMSGIHTNPPLCITEEQLAEGFAAIDGALDIVDRMLAG